MKYFDATSRSNTTVLQPIESKRTSFFESRTERMIVPKFYHDGTSYDFF